MSIPQEIEELAHKVRNEIYGRDVREAIASSMEATAEVAEWSREVAQQIVDGSFDEGALNTAIEQKLNVLEQQYAPNLTNLESEIENARGNESSLVNRLNSTDSQLAQTEQRISQKRDKVTPIGLNDVDEEFLTAVTGGEGVSLIIEGVPRDYTVTPRKTTFINKSTNLFNKFTVFKGFAISPEDGLLVENPVYVTSKHEKINHLSSYSIKTVDAGRIAFYDSDYNFISSRMILSDIGELLIETVPSNARTFRLHTNRRHLGVTQVNEGDTLLPYEEYYETLDSNIELPLDRNDVELSYADGRLAEVQNGNTTTTLNYNADGSLSGVSSTTGLEFIQTELVYEDGLLVAISRN